MAGLVPAIHVAQSIPPPRGEARRSPQGYSPYPSRPTARLPPPQGEGWRELRALDTSLPPPTWWRGGRVQAAARLIGNDHTTASHLHHRLRGRDGAGLHRGATRSRRRAHTRYPRGARLAQEGLFQDAARRPSRRGRHGLPAFARLSAHRSADATRRMAATAKPSSASSSPIWRSRKLCSISARRCARARAAIMPALPRARSGELPPLHRRQSHRA